LGILSLLGDALKQVFKEDPGLLIIIVAALLLLIWIFKETQIYIKNKDEKDVSLLEQKLIAYAQLRAYLSILMKTKSPEDEVQLLNHLGSYAPHFSFSILQKSYRLLENTHNPKEIADYILEIDNEIKNLKQRYDFLRPDEDRTKVFGTISSYFQLAEHIGKPFYLTGITVFLLIVIILISSLLNNGDYAGFFNGISLILLLLVGMGSLSLILDKKFKHSKKNWAFLIGLFSISLMFIYSYNWHLGIVNIILIFVYLSFFAPIIKKEKFRNGISN
jgi:hypothetical protein